MPLAAHQTVPLHPSPCLREAGSAACTRRLLFLWMVLPVLLTVPLRGQGFWEALNGPPGVPIVLCGFNARGDAYVLPYRDNVFKTTDRGEHWFRLTFGAGPEDLVFIGCNSQGTTYAVSRDSRMHILFANDSGWSHLPPVSSGVLAFCITPNDYMFLATYAGGIYRSTNGGAAWLQMYKGLPAGFTVNALVPRESTGDLFAASDKGIFRAPDYGTVWTNIWRDTAGVLSFVATPGALYAGTMKSGLFRSTDDGASWNLLDTLFLGSPIRILRNAPDGTLYLVRSNLVHRSTDGGDTWSVCFSTTMIIDVLGVDRDGSLYAASDGVLSVSTDRGANWHRTVFCTSRIHSISLESDGTPMVSSDRQWLYRYSLQQGGWERMNRPSGSVDQIFRSSDGVLNVLTPQLYRSRDDGASWKNCQAPTGVNDLAVDRRGKLWIATSNALYGTTDEGSLWTAWNLGGAGVSDVLVSPFGTLVASTGHFRGVCVSSDFGATWSERNSGFPPEWWPPLIVQLWTDSSGTLYAQDDIPDRLFRLTAGTDSWVAVRPEFIVNKVGCMVITRNNTLYMTFDNTLIHRSHDRGEHWEPITRDLLPEGITKFAIAPDGRIYVGTAGAGVFRSRETVVSVEEPVSRPAPIDISVYPNPSKGRSRIRYMLPASGHVLIKIHDIMGREIASPLDAESGPGYHELEWDAVSLPAGAYLIRLSSGSFSRTVINFLLR